MKKRNEKERNWILGVISLFVLTYLVVQEYEWFVYIDTLIYQLTWSPNNSLITMTKLFSNTATIFFSILVGLFFSLLLWVNKKRTLAIWYTTNIFIVSFFGMILKIGVARPRPIVGQLIEKNSYSYPSGHTILAMCIVYSMILILRTTIKKNQILKIVLVSYVVLIGVSRLFLRVHYPSDIIGGFLLSFTWINFSYYLIQRDKLRKKYLSKKLFLLMSTFMILISSIGIAFGSKVIKNVKDTANTMYQPIERQSVQVTKKNREPISFLILGIANDSKRKNDYRANTIMIVTVNNSLKETTITSVPRDSYVEIANQDGLRDKINHAHSYGGEKMMIDTVENYLEIPINHYFSIDMDGLSTLVDAMGGVTVDNKFEFDAEGIHYPEGKQHLNGWESLQYARMRYEDPLGDYGRQRRQREVITLLSEKMLRMNTLLNYKEILASIGDNGRTDMTFEQMFFVLKNYQDALGNIKSDQIQGKEMIGDGDKGKKGISYQEISEAEQERVRKMLKKHLNLK